MSEKHFYAKLFMKFPNGHFISSKYGGSDYIFFTHDPLDAHISHNIREYRSVCTFKDGRVIKDDTKTFNSVGPQTIVPPTNPFTGWIYPNGQAINGTPIVMPIFPVLNPYEVDDSPDIYIYKTQWTELKCECGAQSVGSNKHSSWCQIKGD